MRGQYQGGSLAGFIIIGALLALVLVGGLYGLNRYNAEMAANQLSEQADKDAEQAKKEVAKQNKEPVPADDPVKQPTSDEKLDSPAASSPSSDAAPSTPAPTPAAAPTPPETTQPTAASSLPQTGPADTVLSLIAVSALAFAVMHYSRSRQHTR